MRSPDSQGRKTFRAENRGVRCGFFCTAHRYAIRRTGPPADAARPSGADGPTGAMLPPISYRAAIAVPAANPSAMLPTPQMS